MDGSDLSGLRDLDRSERIYTGYRVIDGVLRSFDVDWDVPGFLDEGNGDHSLEAQIAFCRSHQEADGHILGAFINRQLIGIGVIRHNITPSVAQLAYLHVSRQERRNGVGRSLFSQLVTMAIQHGAQELYVSATPSESAIGFYLEMGFSPTDRIIEDLYNLEPEDIHMRMSLLGSR